MAIVGNFWKVEALLAGRTQLQEVLRYLEESLDRSSAISRRIFSKPDGAFDRLNLGNRCFALEQVFTTRERSHCFFESHIRYLDFQLVLSGQEQMELVSTEKLEEQRRDETKDVIFYGDTPSASKLVLEQGDLAIFFPEDAHMGLPYHLTPQTVRKTVVKVPTELFHGL